METNKVIKFIFYLSLLVLAGVIIIPLLLAIILPGDINITNFINYFISSITFGSIFVGIYFSPIAILISVVSFLFNRREVKYFLIILAINLIFISFALFGLKIAMSNFPPMS
jgi:hypothetical protein